MYEILTNMYEAIRAVVEGTELEMLDDEYFRNLTNFVVSDIYEAIEAVKEGE